MRTQHLDSHAKVLLRFAGPHETSTEIYRDAVRIYMPGAVISIGDGEAARSTERVWRDAGRAIGKIFPTEDRAPGYEVPVGSRVYTTVALIGWVQGRDIQGKLPPISRSGCGELMVRLGSLVITMDDRLAAETQLKAWNEAHALARHLFWTP